MRASSSSSEIASASISCSLRLLNERMQQFLYRQGAVHLMRRLPGEHGRAGGGRDAARNFLDAWALPCHSEPRGRGEAQGTWPLSRDEQDRLHQNGTGGTGSRPLGSGGCASLAVVAPTQIIYYGSSSSASSALSNGSNGALAELRQRTTAPSRRTSYFVTKSSKAARPMRNSSALSFSAASSSAFRARVMHSFTAA